MTQKREKPLFSFVILADTHITDEAGTAVDAETTRIVRGKFTALLDKITELEPDFVIHLGDVTHPGPLSNDYPDAAQEFHDLAAQVGKPWYLLPGNHDIGEKLHRALPRIDESISISERSIARYQQHFGPQYQSFVYESCVFVLLNAILFNSGLPDEAAQWDWLEETLKTHEGARIFMCSHYPLFLSDENEPDHYDNIAQPARARLAALVRRYDIEGIYTGHVHNWFYNSIGKAHHFTLPSTSINRHDYLEFFRTAPSSRADGRFDAAKTGFFWIDVYPNSHVPHLMRQSAPDMRRTHAWAPGGALPQIDLRMPWCERQEVATPWGAEIFERKRVRNDYPLSALWEMGVKALRVPVCDLIEKQTARRVRDLATLGHRFTVVLFGLPSAARQAALAAHRDAIDRIEIVALMGEMREMAGALADLRNSLGLPVFLNPTHAEVHGYTSAHGLSAANPADADWLAGSEPLCKAIDGIVFAADHAEAPLSALTGVRDLASAAGVSASLHVRNVRMCRTKAPDGLEARANELGRVAEAVMIARAASDIQVMLDNLVELERGYFHCFGLYDRLYNPQPGSRIISSLDSVLPARMEDLKAYETESARIITARAGTSMEILVLPRTAPATPVAPAPLPDELSKLEGEGLDLVSGEQATCHLQGLIACFSQSGWSPHLLRATAKSSAL